MAPKKKFETPPKGASTTACVLYNGIWRGPYESKKGYRPAWVLRINDEAEECYKVRWSDRSDMLADEDEVREAGEEDEDAASETATTKEHVPPVRRRRSEGAESEADEDLGDADATLEAAHGPPRDGFWARALAAPRRFWAGAPARPERRRSEPDAPPAKRARS